MKKKQRKVVLFGAMLAMVIGVLGIYPLHTQARTGVKFIQLNMTKKAMYVNQSMNLKVKRVTPSRASAAVIWSTSNKNVATVTQNGTVTAKNVGTAKIKAVSKNNRNVKAQCTITVTQNGAVKHSGSYKKVSWKIYENGLLDVKGSGSLAKDNYNCGWFAYRRDITSARLQLKNTKNLSNVFSKFYFLKRVDLRDLDTSKVKNMQGMFYNCVSLETLDLSAWNTEQLKIMGSVEDETNDYSCLGDGEFTEFYTYGMFSNCKSLKEINLSNFNTSNVTRMGYLFNGCRNLKKIDLSSFDTANVHSMSGMFKGCKNLQAIDVSKFNTSNVYRMNYMFFNCEKLKEINISNFNTKKVYGVEGMFYGCKEIKILDLSNLDFSNVRVQDYGECNLIDGCKNLQTVLTPQATCGSKINFTSEYYWVDAQGKEYVTFPQKATESVTLNRGREQKKKGV
jgi:surface protein